MTDRTRRSPVRLLVAEDDPVLLSAISDLLDGEEGMSVVGTARDAAEAIRLAADHRPDVAILDVKMPGGGGTLATREIQKVSPATRVVAFSVHDDRASTVDMVRAGALSFVSKADPVDELLVAIDRAARGLASLSGSAVAGVALELDRQLAGREQEDHDRQRIATEIQGALAPGGLRSVFQPIFELEPLRLVGYEALTRFDTEPVRGPDRWFDADELVDLRFELEAEALRVALASFDDLPSSAYLSVNVSPATVVSGRIDDVLVGLAHERIVIEITEHAVVVDYDALARALAPVRAAGGRLAVDDAGAGFASLRHILHLGPGIIKLDIDLTRGIDADRSRRSLARSLIAFAAETGITIVAEGIETEAELTALRSLGAGCGQGYLLGRPGDLPRQVAPRSS